MNNKVTYHQQVSYCGKPRCKKCRAGIGHGPYWYAYKTVDGRTTRTYVGKQLPPDVQATLEGTQAAPSPHALEREQASLRIYTLGQFRLERRTISEWQTVTEPTWQHQRVRGVLACLVSAPARKLPREQLMDALWSDQNLEIAASRLDRSVHSLRQVFEPARTRIATSPLLLTERDMLLLAEQNHVWIDADAFEHLVKRASASSDLSEKEHLLEEAATLYGGDFLPEVHTLEWTLTRRDTLQRSWIGLLIELADARIQRDALTSAIDPLDRLLSLDPTNEAAVQRLMKLLAQLDRRGEALRTYKHLHTVLQQEYNIRPLPETRSLYEAIRSGTDIPTTTTTGTLGNTSSASSDRGRTSIGTLSVQIGRAHQSQLVGREQELHQLNNLAVTTERVAKFRLTGQRRSSSLPLDTQRRPQSMLLMGEVGIGKTRIAEEVARESKKRGWAVAWSRVYAQESSIPYRLWTDVLRKTLSQSVGSGLASGTTPGLALPTALVHKAGMYQPLGTLLPDIQSQLPHVSFPSALPPEQEQLRLWEAVLGLLTTISEGTPLLIVLDDLQWSDTSSCELFAYLARRIHGYPIIIIGTCRDNELPLDHILRPLLTDLQREHAVETLPLAPLSDEQIATLVAYLPQPIVQHIQTRAAGNPFFAEELARVLPTTTVVGTSFSASAPAPSGTGDETPIPLPDSITAVLDLRLSHLSNACQRLLSKAAVLGGSFEFPTISSMEVSSTVDEDTVLDLLEEALQAGMLTEEGTGTRITYQFWHPLLVSHLYESLSAARRASQHRRAAEVLRQAYAHREEEGAATITHHLVHGGADSQQITHYARLAGDRAYSLSVYPDAEKHYRIALAHLGTHTNELPMHAYLLECLGECTRIQGKDEEARTLYEQALHVCNQQGQQHSIASIQERVLEAQIQALLWCEVAMTWYDIGDNTKAREYCTRGERVLQDAEVTTGPAWAKLRYQQSYISWREGAYAEAQRTANEALALFEDALKQPQNIDSTACSIGIRRTLLGDAVNLGRMYVLLGMIANGVGQNVEAIEHWNKALALFEPNDRLRDIAIVCCDLGDAYLKKAEFTQAKASLRRSLSLAERIGDIPLMSFAIGNMGILDIRIGNIVAAEEEFKQCISLVTNIHDLVSTSMWESYLATVLLEQNRFPEAQATLCHALKTGHTMRFAPCIGLALISLANIRLAQAITIVIENETPFVLPQEVIRILNLAKRTLQRALTLEGIDAEHKTEGQLILAHVHLLLNSTGNALQLAEQTLEEARTYGLTWLVACAQRVLANILETQNDKSKTSHYYEQALRTFRKYGMRLEYARTLQQYGATLLKWQSIDNQGYQRGLACLHEAHQVFSECKASLDEYMTERLLASHEQVPTP